MRLGKLDNDALERLVLSKFTKCRQESLTRPMIGADCATLDMDADLVVLSMDPITSAAKNIGALTVYINCNDAAAAGAEPVGLMVTLLAPPSSTLDDISNVASELAIAAKNANVDILGGHTEVTDSVTRMVTCATVVARAKKDKLISPSGMVNGDDIVITKYAGLEGTALIASDFGAKLDLSDDDREVALAFYSDVSVVKEGVIAAKCEGTSAMHDITEGGVLGAAWELASASGVGMIINTDAIPVHDVTRRVCGQMNIDALRLLSSGSMMIATKNGRLLCRLLEKANVKATIIGRAIENNSGVIDQYNRKIDPPGADEIYKLF